VQETDVKIWIAEGEGREYYKNRFRHAILITDEEYGFKNESMERQSSHPYTFHSTDESVIKVDEHGQLRDPRYVLMEGEPASAYVVVTKTTDNSRRYIRVTVSSETDYRFRAKINDEYSVQFSYYLLDKINYWRSFEGLEPLEYLDIAQEMVNARSKEVAKKYGHIRPDGTEYYTISEEYALDRPIISENIAAELCVESENGNYYSSLGMRDEVNGVTSADIARAEASECCELHWLETSALSINNGGVPNYNIESGKLIYHMNMMDENARYMAVGITCGLDTDGCAKMFITVIFM